MPSRPSSLARTIPAMHDERATGFPAVAGPDVAEGLPMSSPFPAYLLVFVGGGLGSVLRYQTNAWAVTVFGQEFPWGTLLVNIVGSAVMGFFAGWLHWRFPPEVWGSAPRLFLMTGVLGGYTTFSAFSLDAVSLWERGATGGALAYALGSVLLSVAALVLGLALARGAIAA